MTFVYDDTGSIKTDAEGKPLRWALNTLRPPCDSCEKVPVGIRSSGKPWRELQKAAHETTEASRRATRHFRQCQAIGNFPADDIVKWCAGIIADVEKEYERYQRERSYFPTELFVDLMEILIRR